MSEKRFGMFEGVFTPCILSILGVIMYLRLGWVVGQAGFIGAVVIICLANFITLTTALSMSSVVTNIRIGAGGAYSIITKSLGMEAGGAVGLPLYISQAISVAFYITGFSEAWLFIFPGHDPILISVMAWTVLFVVTMLSTRLAFQLQFGILALIVLSLISIFCAKDPVSTIVTSSLGHFSYQNFWPAFAIFFPAATGILAGASMSGELKDPRHSIPFGTMVAIGISLVVYLLLAYWFAIKVDTQQLVSNNLIAIDLGRWKPLVIAGIMGATISSALAMFVGAPRVLLALGKHSIVPFSSSLSRVNSRGEPVGAILFTALIALITIMLGSLDQIAVLLTEIFLITYGMINMIVFLEQSMGIVSFRPTFRVPRIVSFLGAAGCLCVMFIIDARFSIVAFSIILVIYIFLIRRKAEVYSPDIRSGLLVYLAEKFAKAADQLPYYPKIWKPNIIMPVKSISHVESVLGFIRSVIFPSGRITMFHVQNVAAHAPVLNETRQMLEGRLREAVQPLRDEDIFIETTVVEGTDVLSSNITAMQAIKGMFFPPNMFMCLLDDYEDPKELEMMVEKAAAEGLGILLLKEHPEIKVQTDNGKTINLWVRENSPNMNLSILIALQLERNWEGHLRILQVVNSEEDKAGAQEYLEKLKDVMRLPVDAEMVVCVGSFKGALEKAPKADINILGMTQKLDMNMMHDVANQAKTAVILLRDSKHESAVA